ncbi:hypothetical protein GPA10_22355 [Streptomyces sp. p1417]|uniref:Uncharacterized protein n=1 Tax=Streptomyces typhae TaxID=2681492 RepID=A0A6L6X0U7_9ACTN|nr:hypothetical protein [Streptomyces typhae]MVO87428.1 hypothetical protein [Streptomyces typhae]
MADEISYPFTADSPSGGQQMMSQQQWQYLARLFAKDRVDHRLTSRAAVDSATLPFFVTAGSTTAITVNPGRAVVGGFYYQLTAAKTLPITANTGPLGRIDLLVLRADLTAGSVNVAVLAGQPATAPKAPSLTRNYGGLWEMPLYKITAPPNGAALDIVRISPFDMAEHVAVPWNAAGAGEAFEPGTFVYDMDANLSGVQTEYFVSRDGYAPTRNLGRALRYTPKLVNAKSDLPSTARYGHWRWIAPGLVHLSLRLVCDYEDQGVGGTSTLGVTLPRAAAFSTGQVLKGFMSNPTYGGGLPNNLDITAVINKGSAGQNVAYLYRPNSSTVSEGLDGLKMIPPQSTLTISGVYDTDTFGD